MKLTDLLSEIIREESLKDIVPGVVTDESEKQKSYSKLSDVELSQLGAPASTKSNRTYVPYELWPTFRKFLVNRSVFSNKSLNPEFTAYTPGETLHLINNSVISEWLNKMKSYKVPDDYKKIIFVPCAKTKPWENATKGIYKDYNKLRNEHPDWFFVTISEPLGIVPQTFWGNFPQYDNPGLFKNDAARSGLFTQEFKKHFGVNYAYKVPFDQAAYDQAIEILSKTIKSFIENNRDKDMISFVEDFDDIGTHSDMLTKAGFTGRRLYKREKSRSGPYDYIKKNI